MLFLLGCGWKSLFVPRHDVIMSWTDPPLVGLIGVALKYMKESKLIYVAQDVYPEVSVAAGKMNGAFATALLRWASKTILKHADQVIVLGNDMKDLILRKGCSLGKVQVIHNWQDLDKVRPADGSHFRKELGIREDQFVIMHSGNIGLSQDFETLLSVAKLTKNNDALVYIFVGDGSRKPFVENQINTNDLKNVRLVPYQSFSKLSQSLSAADIHYVSLRSAFKGCIVPSKIYGILAAGKPVLGNVPPQSEVERIIQETYCGVLSAPIPQRMATTLRNLYEKRARLSEMGKRGRTWMELEGGRKQAAQKYNDMIELVIRS